MKRVEPKVFLVGKTELDEAGVRAYLESIGIEEDDWSPDPDVSGCENLTEFGGRICYKSWAPWDPSKPEGTNPNVTRVREGNYPYLKNIVKSEHGAVVEHANVSMVFKDVSRVFTHEMVRHRAGWAYSQESLRYVRLDAGIRAWLPELIAENPAATKLMEGVIAQLEGAQRTLHEIFDVAAIKDFAVKKKLTSAFRRVAPIGLATTILVTGNVRAWRHVISQRTSVHAEAEARLVLGMAARILKERFPHLFWDMQENDQGEWALTHPKI